MTNFIVRDQQKADLLASELESKFFSSDTNHFLRLYNAGVIVKNNKEVSNILALFAQAYKNVSLPSRLGAPVTLLSEEEIVLRESLESLQHWIIATKIRRMVQAAINDKAVDANGVLFLEKVAKPTEFVFAVLHKQTNPDTGNVDLVPEQLPKLEALNKDEAEFAVKHFIFDDVTPEVKEATADKGVLISVQKVLEVNTQFVGGLNIPDFKE